MPEVISVTQPAGTNHLEIKYRIIDPDDANVKVGLLAFKDGRNDSASNYPPDFHGNGLSGKLDENTTTDPHCHRSTGNRNVSWNDKLIDLAQDDRELMNFHFLTLPATDSNFLAA